MCNHDEQKEATYLAYLDFPGHEIYMCECGALIDIANEKNYHDPIHPMTPEELRELLNDVFAPIKSFVASTEELEKMKLVLQTISRKA